MEIIRAKHMGFCFGVSGAIETCYNVLKFRKENIYTWNACSQRICGKKA